MTTLTAKQFLSWCDSNDRDLGIHIFNNFVESMVSVNPDMINVPRDKWLDMFCSDFEVQISDGYMELVPIGKPADTIVYTQYNV